MNLAPHTQALMLSVLYGEASEAEHAEWAALSAENTALAQEYERLKATITIINESQKIDEEDDIFFAAQWEELHKVIKPNDNAPVMISLPQIEKVESAQRIKFFRPSNVAVQRWYWAAATILVSVGLSFSVYRWQMSELKSSSVQNTIQESEAASSLNNTESSSGASLSGKTDALQSRAPQTKDAANSSSAGRRSERQEQGMKGLAQPEEQKPSAAPLAAPQNKKSSDQAMPSDDVKKNTLKDNAMKNNSVHENVAKDKESSRLEDMKESTKSLERKKSEEAQAEESPQLQNKQSVESEVAAPNLAAPKLSAPKQVAPQSFESIERFQSAPVRLTPQNAPSALPTSAKPASIKSSTKNKLLSTNATIRLDSAQKRDSNSMKR